MTRDLLIFFFRSSSLTAHQLTYILNNYGYSMYVALRRFFVPDGGNSRITCTWHVVELADPQEKTFMVLDRCQLIINLIYTVTCIDNLD
jgi:hypothetical protein